MRLLLLSLCLVLPLRTSALEIEAPAVPEAGQAMMPETTNSLSQGLLELLEKAVLALEPELAEAARVSLGIIAAVLLVSVLRSFASASSKTADMAGALAVAAMLLLTANAMVTLASTTVRELADYGKLLLSVLTAALAAQGGVTTSAALYGGTALFTALLQGVMSNLLVPGVHLYLALCVAGGATGQEGLKKIGDLLKGFLSWCLKTLLIVFTSWLSLTHVISGTADAAALKAARVSMSSFIPVVGGILSEASEAVLVSAGLMKNAAGIYGILATLALGLQPFLRIASHYLLLKCTGGLSTLFGPPKMTGIIDCFSSAMGLLLGMTGAGCVMVLISTVCFMKGVL